MADSLKGNTGTKSQKCLLNKHATIAGMYTTCLNEREVKEIVEIRKCQPFYINTSMVMCFWRDRLGTKGY